MNYSCQRAVDCSEPNNSDYAYDTKTSKLDDLLNIAPASFEGIQKSEHRSHSYN